MEFDVVEITQDIAEEIATWHYPEPYTMYSLSSQEIPILLNPSNRYYAVVGIQNSLVGYWCFGAEARVIGGDYSELEPPVLDVGVGMHPDKTGCGLGKGFVSATLRFASETYNPDRFRVTVAKFNKRSRRTFQALKFVETFRFSRSGDDLEFIQLEREATPVP